MIVGQKVSGAAAEQAGKRRPAFVIRLEKALLGAGGSGYPMDLLRTAGADLSQPDTVRAVATELDGLVSQLENALKVQ